MTDEFNRQAIGLALAALAVLLAAGFFLRRYLNGRPSPEEAERRRRATIHRRGKLGDGEIVDIEGAAIVYEYHVAGVSYTATQDVSSFEPLLASDLLSMIGPASVKFDRYNPANSIVICEEWSGLRLPAPRALESRPPGSPVL
jgi:hypothetical protein